MPASQLTHTVLYYYKSQNLACMPVSSKKYPLKGFNQWVWTISQPRRNSKHKTPGSYYWCHICLQHSASLSIHKTTTNIVSYNFVYESNNQNNINKHCKYKMAAKRSKLCKMVGDWLFLGQLININEHVLPFSPLPEARCVWSKHQNTEEQIAKWPEQDSTSTVT